jgi:hypothetical protein
LRFSINQSTNGHSPHNREESMAANPYDQIISRRREEMRRVRAEQNAAEATANEVRDRVGETAWTDLVERQQLAERKRGNALEFYRDASGAAQYRFRKSTDAELAERASDWVEDNL